MLNRRWIFVAGLALCGSLALLYSVPLSAQQKSSESATSDKDSEKQTEHDLDVRYAEQYLKLVEATLAKYQYTNRKLPNTIRPAVIQAIEEGVREARERVQLAKSDDTSDADIYISSAESELRATQSALRKAEAANLANSGTVLQVEIDRLNAELELAKIRVEKARHLAKESPLSNVQYEIEQLREDVHELRLIVALLRDRN